MIARGEHHRGKRPWQCEDGVAEPDELEVFLHGSTSITELLPPYPSATAIGFDGSGIHLPSTQNFYACLPGLSVINATQVALVVFAIGLAVRLQLLKNPPTATTFASGSK